MKDFVLKNWKLGVATTCAITISLGVVTPFASALTTDKLELNNQSFEVKGTVFSQMKNDAGTGLEENSDAQNTQDNSDASDASMSKAEMDKIIQEVANEFVGDALKNDDEYLNPVDNTSNSYNESKNEIHTSTVGFNDISSPISNTIQLSTASTNSIVLNQNPKVSSGDIKVEKVGYISLGRKLITVFGKSYVKKKLPDAIYKKFPSALKRKFSRAQWLSFWNGIVLMGPLDEVHDTVTDYLDKYVWHAVASSCGYIAQGVVYAIL
ncbi:hypothetical protein C7B63_11425 [Bacillus halotolerans]|nr:MULTISPECIES: hypothetical protein [Bacillus]MCY7766424.1 hypothetical protein [Bacillus inaquosorum]MCY7942538.1 hypothetical protein [Bacillus inaquosorum]MCY7983834.1 hypothetical protein [Bacillus inaquosorum]MCY8070239.1 hypothetical protein [Bacillus inaquosorum]MCY8146955.1 hypothetical protein [Bacillus inaquosorum]